MSLWNQLIIVATGLLLAPVTSSAPAWPRFSWDTVPVFYHSCNFSGPFTDSAVQVMAKFPMVTIEKGQGLELPGHAEDKIVAVLKRVKEVDPNISTIFYYNSILDWPFYKMHDKLLTMPDLWMRDDAGAVCRTSGDASFPNASDMLSWDFRKPEARDFWASECINITNTGYVDGCFSDRSNGAVGGCKGRYNQKTFQEGHLLVHQQLQKALGNGVLIANNDPTMPGVSGTMLEMFKADEQSIKSLQTAAALGKITQAHAGNGMDGADKHCSSDITNSLAAFLIGAGERSYYGCSRGWKVQADPIDSVWHPEYDKPLGAPIGLATKVGSVYTRHFKGDKGLTTVMFDTGTNEGTIDWAGETANINITSRAEELVIRLVDML